MSGSEVRTDERAPRAGHAADQSAPPQQEQQSTPQPTVSFEALEVLSRGYTNTSTVTLRESPQATAKILAVLKLESTEYVDVLDATRDYLRVRFTAESEQADEKEGVEKREGWVAWGEVVPAVTAIVLDAATGEVVSRLPFNGIESDSVYVNFSPDNSRAVFYGSDQAYEVNTEDYTLKRSLKAQLDAKPFLSDAFFYGSPDNTLYAAFDAAGYSRPTGDGLLNIVRVSRKGEPPASMPEISERAFGFVVAPDGRTGFILHPADAQKEVMLVDVLDLQSMRVSNTLSLRGESLPSSAQEFALSADGSQLYASLFPSRDVISVIDTRTNRLLRELPTGSLHEQARYLTQSELVGDALLLRVWDATGDNSQNYWLTHGKTIKAQRGIDLALEAGGVRLAVNDSGTQLYHLDSDHRIHQKYAIDRPDVRLDPGNAEAFGVSQLFASPDGKHLILIIVGIDRC
jgi:hypothetical protein